MAIEGNKVVNVHRDQPIPPGFTIQVTWFVPSRETGPLHSVTSAEDVRHILGPYQNHERLFIDASRDGGDSGYVFVHLTGDHAFVAHFTQPGGIDSYCCDRSQFRSDVVIGFKLDNGQLDKFPRFWTVSRADGLKAIEYFVEHGERDPSLDWVEQPQSLEEPLR
jgi:hypothetical protein